MSRCFSVLSVFQYIRVMPCALYDLSAMDQLRDRFDFRESNQNRHPEVLLQLFIRCVSDRQMLQQLTN